MTDPDNTYHNSQAACPECESPWQNGLTCQNCFHQLLFWENENPELGSVHHLMVLSYHLQHPSLYSPAGLKHSLQQLVDFIEAGLTPRQVLKYNRTVIDSGFRKWTYKPKPGSVGVYRHPISWQMTVQDVVKEGANRYRESVQRWARSIIVDIRSTGNFRSIMS
jgi:hypothetical protein